MTTQELLDHVAQPVVEATGCETYTTHCATLSLAGGIAFSRHYFLFHSESPVKKRRSFEHMGCDDRWEKVSEKRLLEFYPNANWTLEE